MVGVIGTICSIVCKYSIAGIVPVVPWLHCQVWVERNVSITGYRQIIITISSHGQATL